MTRSVDQVNAAVYEIRSMPYGIARSAAAAAELERVVAEGPDAARAYTLFALVESYVWGGEVAKAYLPFTQMLRWWDEHPEHFDAEDAHSLFWSFKWMVGHLVEFPTVPAEQIERTLEDMARRYALAGNGMNAVALERFDWARERGAADVEEAYRAWVATPRDEFSQCEACEPGDRAAYLFETGRYDEGIRLLEQVLTGSPRCATEPGDMLSHLQLAYLEVGDVEAAARTHRRGLRHLDNGVTMDGPQGRHVEFLARTGNADRALRRVVDQQRHLVESDSPGERLGFLTSVGVATRVLRAEHGDEPLALREVPATTVAELDDWVRDEAAGLARAFDARNGTTAASDRLRRAAERAERLLPVDLGVLGASDDAPSADRAHSADGADPAAVPVGTDGVVPAGAAAPDGPDALLEQAEAVAAEDPVRSARLQRRAAELFEASGRLDRAGFALAEAAQVAALEGDVDAAVPAFGRAVALLHAGGVPARYVGAVVRAAARLAASGDDVTAALGAVDRVLAGLATTAKEAGPAGGVDAASSVADGSQDALAERERAADAAEARELRDTRARLLATAGELLEAAAAAESVAEDYARAGQVPDAAHAFWLAGRSRAQAGEHADAVDALESAMEGFAIVGDRDARVRVADELVTTLQHLGRDDDAARVAQALTA